MNSHRRLPWARFWGLKYRNPAPDRIHAQHPNVRCLWTEFFALNVDSPWPGWIQVSPQTGYTDEQLYDMTNLAAFLTFEDFLAAKAKLAEIGEIEVVEKNRVRWVRQKETQTPYQRQKAYRLQPEVTPESDTGKLHPKVTPEDLDTEERGERKKGRSKDSAYKKQLGSKSLVVPATPGGKAKGTTDPIERARRSRNPVKTLVGDLAQAKALKGEDAR